MTNLRSIEYLDGPTRRFAVLVRNMVLAVSVLSGQVIPKPLVTIMTRLPGPTNPVADNQWVNTTVPAHVGIPDNWTAGVDSETIWSPVGGSCAPLFGVKISVDINHPRVSDLFVSLEARSADGKSVLQSVLLFDGRRLALTKTDDEITGILHGDLDAGQLFNAGYCGRWRLNVADLASGQTGTLNSWTLKLRTAWFPFTHNMNYYQRMLFGDNSPPDPSKKPVVNDYFREVSRNQFSFTFAGAFGPADWTTWRNATDATHVADIIHLLEAQGFNFAQYDHNGNGRIDNDELEILAIDNSTDDLAANRGGDCVTLTRSSLQVCARVALVGQQIDFESLTHELSHSLGTVDLYAEGCFSYQLTLMSCTENGPDNLDSVYLDPWHRKKLGWVFPYAVGANFYEMGDETWTDFYGAKSRPAVFYKSGTLDEYYLFEYRGARNYDRAVANWGIVAWHVLEDGKGNPGDPIEGHAIYAFSPVYRKGDQDIGGNKTWNPGDGRFQVKWKDGSYLPLSFWAEQPKSSSNSMILHWDAAPANNAPPSIRILQPANNSSGPIGFGVSTVLQADVKDARGGTAGLRIRWVSDLDGDLGTGLKTSASFLTPGPRNITVIASDQYGATSISDSIRFTAVAVAPVATIFSPATGQTFYRNQPITLNGKGSNGLFFEFDCKRLMWTVDRIPGWYFNGCQESVPFNLIGPLKVTLTVFDDSVTPVLTGAASVTVNLIDPPPGSAPIVTITAPTGVGLWATDTYTVSGSVMDPQGGPVTYRWTVTPAGGTTETQISTSPTFQWIPASVFTTNIDFDLRLYGTNSRGQMSVAKRTYTVQQPPR